MTKTFTHLSVTFDYHLILEKRRTMVIAIKPDLSVIVKAPLHAEEEKIEDFLRHKLRWILKHRRYYAQFKPALPKEYVNGESFRYLGQSYALSVQGVAGSEEVAVQEGLLTVFSRRPHSPLYTAKLLQSWYAQEAAHIFAERLQICAERFVPDNLPALAIRTMKSRLGSYSTRTHRVCLSADLIKVDLKYIDYVIIHELCHITHLSHNKNFYHLLSRCLPEWKQLEAELESSLLSQ